MPPLWKSASSAGRPRPGQQSSIRGRISGPIPIPNPGDDDEFPIRTPGSGIAIPANDDENFEFPIRKPGSGIATTYALPEDALEEQDVQAQRQRQQQQQQAQAQELQPPPPPQAGVSAGSVSGSHTDTSQNSDGGSNPQPPSQPGAPAAEPPSERSRSSSGHRGGAIRTPSRHVSPPQQRRRSPPAAQAQTTAPTPASAALLRYSTVSEAPTEAQSSRSREGGTSPKRKKSTLRTALGRLFGRKKKSRESQGSAVTSGRTSGVLSSTQHRSDPSALGRGNKDGGDPKRSTSLPITEYDRALRSHSIGPDTITAIESARNSLQATTTANSELGGLSPGRKRAATTEGRLYPPYHSSSLRAGRASVEGGSGWASGLSPRPASTHGRGSRVLMQEALPPHEDPSEIGRAITSDSGGGSRRRSRSLSGLNDVFTAAGNRASSGGQQQEVVVVVRRRSDEIKYWRESYNAGFRSPLSNAQAEAETDKEQDQDDAKSGVVDESAPQSPVDNNDQQQHAPQQQQQQPPPPQPFNFEALARDMVGMKITQAASMDARIGGLEARMARLERAVDRLCRGAVPGTPMAETASPAVYHQTASSDLGNSPSRHSTAEDDDDDSAVHHSSHFSFGEAQTYIGSLHAPSSSSATQSSLTVIAPSNNNNNNNNRPTSDATVRGATSLPTLGGRRESDDPHTTTTAVLLQSQVDAERAARRDLEAQVAKLSARLNTLSATMYAMVRGEGGGIAKARSQEQLLLSPLPQPQPTPATAPHVPPVKQATLSAFDADDENAHDNKPGEDDDHDDDDDRRTEEFLTPGEERSTLGGYGFGAFGEPLRVNEDDETEADDDDDDGDDGRNEAEDKDDAGRKKAARTLSLSQLTLGKKGGRAVVRI